MRQRIDQGAGPRGTPTVDGDRLHVLTENGDLACLKTDGSPAWQLNILKEFRGTPLPWLIRERSWAHPAISDGRLYVRNQDTLLVYDIRATVQ